MNKQLICDMSIEIAEDHEEYVQSSDIAAMQSEFSSCDRYGKVSR